MHIHPWIDPKKKKKKVIYPQTKMGIKSGNCLDGSPNFG